MQTCDLALDLRERFCHLDATGRRELLEFLFE